MDVDEEPVPAKTEPKTEATKADEEEDDGVDMMALAQQIHRLHTPTVGLDEEAKASLSATILEELGNPSLYKLAFAEDILSDDISKKLNELEGANKVKGEKLQESIENATKNAGDMEILDASMAYAKFAFSSLSKDEAMKAFEDVSALPKLSSGKKIDTLMQRARVACFYNDTKIANKLTAEATAMANDWDRRNRLKVYDAMGKILTRDVKGAAALLVDCIATFSCTEFCTFSEFVLYAIVSNILYLPRVELKAKIIEGAEIISCAKSGEIPEAWKLVNSLYDCDYKSYLNALCELQPVLMADRFFRPHCGYVMRELLILAYKQFLDSYKSVTLESMALSFGVGVDFLDLQLSRFISVGRLTAKIDKCCGGGGAGIVETTRPDLKNAQYQDMISKGDALLGRIQKLARVVDL